MTETSGGKTVGGKIRSEYLPFRTESEQGEQHTVLYCLVERRLLKGIENKPEVAPLSGGQNPEHLDPKPSSLTTLPNRTNPAGVQRVHRTWAAETKGWPQATYNPIDRTKFVVNFSK
ncbi:hypothetical protein TNCV_2571831 [Trichonephila clavipes]|nr:hypothetical protein TNCV_2571831 [Trichonephila clavipes]